MNKKVKSKTIEHKWLDVVESYSRLGSKRLANGTRCVGHIPSIGKHSFLHSVFPVCSKTQINSIEKKVGNIPDSYREFLSNVANGLDLFSGTLILYGYKNWNKSIEEQPYDIVVPNTHERPKWLDAGECVIGFYIWDGSLAVMSETGKVRACEPTSGKVLKSWDGIEDFLNAEAWRLRDFFRESGEEKDEDACTLPT